MPKFNLYQSLHTTVIGPQGKPIEVQIRTLEMHARAEFGVAAHYVYKELPQGSAQIDLPWLDRIIEFEDETNDPGLFMANLKVDLDQDEVFVFTPKGEVITLPAGATPVDFAYTIHTDVGHRTVGAKVDGRLVSLADPLRSGETVEIFTSKACRCGSVAAIGSPSSARRGLRPRSSNGSPESDGRTRSATGQEDLQAAMRREGLPVQKIASAGVIGSVAEKLNYGDVAGSVRRHRRAHRLGEVRGGSDLEGTRRGDRSCRRIAPGHCPSATTSTCRQRGRCPRRRPRRRAGPALALLHPGAGRRDHRFRHPRARACLFIAPTVPMPFRSVPIRTIA